MSENLPAQRQTNAVSTNVQNDRAIQSDLVVPYVVIGQGLSEAVVDRKVQLGDIYKSTSKDVIGGPDKQIQVIMMGPPKPDWVIEQKAKDKFEYRKAEPRTAANDTLPWQFTADDEGNEVAPGTKGSTEWRRVKRLTVFAILVEDIVAAAKEMAKVEQGELPDPSKALTPVVISFRSSSYKTGREISTFFSKAKSMRADIWRYVVTLGCRLEKNDQGSFYVWTADTNKPVAVSKEHLPLVQDWVEMVTNRVDQIVIDEEGDTVANGGGTSAPRDVSGAAKDVC